MNAAYDIPGWLVPVLFVGFVVLIVLVVLIPSWWQRKKLMDHLTGKADLNKNTVDRIQHLEDDNERLIRENMEWKSRAQELFLHLTEREKRLGVLSASVEDLTQKLRVSDDALHALKAELVQEKTDRQKLSRSPFQVERPYDVGRADRGRSNQTSSDSTRRGGNVVSGKSDYVPQRKEPTGGKRGGPEDR